MINISKEKIDFGCPECNNKIVVTLEQVSKQELICCNYCRKEIKLIDKNNSTQRGLKNVNKSLKEIERVLNNFGTLKIK